MCSAVIRKPGWLSVSAANRSVGHAWLDAGRQAKLPCWHYVSTLTGFGKSAATHPPKNIFDGLQLFILHLRRDVPEVSGSGTHTPLHDGECTSTQ